ncbi:MULTISPECIES: hypothetical protein [unclassified Flavobacterium]|uniref:hypothetical protein n=1 Tax=unclassified Flavobacterium TaxID=196869 RepID=UPI002090C94B|nr:MULTISPECIES: hypothetical protein [unclassified Flavobacterium]MCO6162752.1 hypothetical protein [Flavobacterium sp. NRK F7]|tara:strand:- start:1920 stop:2414 length:495 start_codon:yes stop_codon:yes gene_type:complete
MEYFVMAESCNTYNLIHNHSVLGEMDYKGWFNSNYPSFFINGSGNFIIKKPSIWKSNFSIYNGNQKILSSLFQWNGSVLLKLFNQSNVEVFKLKRKSVWKSNYVLLNEKGNELLFIYCQYQWKIWKTKYYIQENTTFTSNNKEILYLTLIHCIINLKNRAAAVA